MFVFMYPENIAVGSLRRRQTPAFRAMVKAIRGSRRLTNDQACALAAEYAAYYEDVAKLAIGATAQATVTRAKRHHVRARRHLEEATGLHVRTRRRVQSPVLVDVRSRRIRAATARASGTLCPAPHRSPVLSAPQSTSALPPIAACSSSSGRAEHKLQFLTFDLESRAWAGPTDLALPAGDARSFDIVDRTRTTCSTTSSRRSRSERAATSSSGCSIAEGTGWEEGDWKRRFSSTTRT